MAGYKYREEWLQALAEKMLPLFDGHKMPKYRVTCGWPSHRSTSKKNKAIGQCFDKQASADGTHELIISMCLDDPMDVAATLAHEMVHAIVGCAAGHKKPFKDLALQIGLAGKMTATTAGEAFKHSLLPILKTMGKYPHASVDATYRMKKKQSTRMIKTVCDDCGYTARITQKWLSEVGAPHCPEHGEMDVES